MRYAGIEEVGRQLADPPTTEGEGLIVGVDIKTPRDQLPPGLCHYAENKRFVRGAATRRGTRTPTFANLLTNESLLGTGVYSNPDGFEFGLLAGASHVILIRSGVIPKLLPVSETLAGKVEFSQQFDKVLLHRDDPSKTTLIWDGLDETNGFVPIAPSIPDGAAAGIVVIPNAPWSINFLGRSWGQIPGTSDSFFASDISDYTTYDSDLHVFRVNSGTSDYLVGLYPYSQTLIVGKRRSIDALENIPFDLGDNYLFALNAIPFLSPSSAPPPSVTVVSSNIGMISRKAVVQVGDRFLFLSDSGKGGIYQIIRGGNSESTFSVDSTPVSDPIEPLIRRINWDYAGGAIARTDGLYAHFSVPLDGATFNNAVLTLNLSNGRWQGVDIWRSVPVTRGRGRRVFTVDNPMRMDNFLTLDYLGVSRLFAANHNAGKIHLMYEGADDQLDEARGADAMEQSTYPIQDLIETRGFTNSDTYRDFEEVHIGLLTLDPEIIVTQIIDGENDERILTLTAITYDREMYDIAWKMPFMPNNQNDDFLAAKRLDYSVLSGDGIMLQDGIPMAQLSPKTLHFSTMARGRFASYRIETMQGYCAVLTVIEGSVSENHYERLLR